MKKQENREPPAYHILTLLICREELNKQLAYWPESPGGLQLRRGGKADTARLPLLRSVLREETELRKAHFLFSLPLRLLQFHNGILSQLLMLVMQFGKKQKGLIIRINILCEERTKASIKYEAELQFQPGQGQTRKLKPLCEAEEQERKKLVQSLFIPPSC